MRYQNWDCLVFPHELCKIPVQEFKTACHVIQDPELHSSQLSPLLVPTVTCFIAGLPAGSPFRISLHCWENPEASQYLQSFSNNPENVVFEGRVFVDGRVAGMKLFTRNGPWPTVMDTGIELNKQGEFEKLRFPTFHRELLAQNYWNAGDDFGRIKIVISEGFPRDNISMPFERVRNLVAFSFQHAPLDVLEASQIAWPNPAMWRQVSLIAPYYAQPASPQLIFDGQDMAVHGHSPRKADSFEQAGRSIYPNRSKSTIAPLNAPAFARPPNYDPFTEPVHAAFRGWRNASATSLSESSNSVDIFMLDASSNSNSRGSSRHVTNNIATRRGEHVSEKMQTDVTADDLCELLQPSAPTNTPKTLVQNTPTSTKNETDNFNPGGSMQTFGDVEQQTLANGDYEKENCGPTSPTAQEAFIQTPILHSTVQEEIARKNLQPFATTNSSGSKRQRIVTPASTRVDDDEPATRKTLGDLDNI